MKIFFIIAALIIYVDASLKKRMTDSEIQTKINNYFLRYNIDGSESFFWKFYHYQETLIEQVLSPNGVPELNPDGSPMMMDVGHHWITAQPLTGENGVPDTKFGPINMHMTYIPNPGSEHTGIINTKLVNGPFTSPTGQIPSLIDSAETVVDLDVETIANGLSIVTNENFQDEANYYKYNTASNCQGFAAAQFQQVFTAFCSGLD